MREKNVPSAALILLWFSKNRSIDLCFILAGEIHECSSFVGDKYCHIICFYPSVAFEEQIVIIVNQ